MVDSVNSGFPKAVPGSNIFKPGEQLEQQIARTNQSNTGEVGNFLDRASNPAQAGRIDSNIVVEQSKTSPVEKILSGSSDRGNNLDITV